MKSSRESPVSTITRGAFSTARSASSTAKPSSRGMMMSSNSISGDNCETIFNAMEPSIAQPTISMSCFCEKKSTN